MGAQRLGYRFEYLGEILVLGVEHDQRGLAVAPCQVTKELVQGSGEARWSSPQLALPDERGTVVLLYADVRLALAAERLTDSIALKVPVQLGQNDVAQIFLAVDGISAGRPLEGAPLVPDEAQDVLEGLIRDARLRRKLRLRGHR